MSNVSKAIKLLNKADILRVDGYLLHNWEVQKLDDLEEDDNVLELSYTDDEGRIFSFEFPKYVFTEKDIRADGSQIDLVDRDGQVVDIYCFKLSPLVLNEHDEQKETVTS